MRSPRHLGLGPLMPTGLLVALLAICLHTEPALAAKPRPAWVIPESMNVRSGPRMESKKISSLTRGTKVYVISFANKWCWCSLPGGGKGWIAEWLLQFSADKGHEIAQAAGKAPTTTVSRSNPPAWVKVSAANVRSAPGLGGDSYGTLDGGTKVYILARQGDWAKCKTPGGSGWVRNDLLEYSMAAGRKLAAADTPSRPKPAPAVASASGKAYVTEDQVYLRSGPGSRFEQRAKLIKGQTLYISGKQGMWRKVTVHGGHSGWVAAWLIKEDKPKAAPSSPDVPDVARTDRVLTAWITADTARVRERPSSESKVKFSLSQGQKVRVAAVCGHWCKLRTESGNYGWVAGWLIKFVPPGKAVTTTEAGEKVEVNVGWVARPVVNLRTAPSTEAPTSGEARLGTRLLIIGKKADWYKVALEDGNIGWMSSRLIDTRAERMVRFRIATAGKDGSKDSATLQSATVSAHDDFPSPTASSNNDDSPSGGMGSDLVATARKFVGCSYVTGGHRPGGFDCQGLMWYVHKVHGIDISFGCEAQFRRGTPVARDDLQPGDVVFFQNTYKAGISHVGLYIGGGRFVHAANHRGGVKISSLSEDYYVQRYVGARRMY